MSGEASARQAPFPPPISPDIAAGLSLLLCSRFGWRSCAVVSPPPVLFEARRAMEVPDLGLESADGEGSAIVHGDGTGGVETATLAGHEDHVVLQRSPFGRKAWVLSHRLTGERAVLPEPATTGNYELGFDPEGFGVIFDGEEGAGVDHFLKLGLYWKDQEPLVMQVTGEVMSLRERQLRWSPCLAKIKVGLPPHTVELPLRS